MAPSLCIYQHSEWNVTPTTIYFPDWRFRVNRQKKKEPQKFYTHNGKEIFPKWDKKRGIIKPTAAGTKPKTIRLSELRSLENKHDRILFKEQRHIFQHKDIYYLPK